MKISLRMLSLSRMRICELGLDVDDVETGGGLLFGIICRGFREDCLVLIFPRNLPLFIVVMEIIEFISWA